MPPDPKPPTVEELHLEALTLARNMAAYAQIPGYPWRALIRSIDALAARVRELEGDNVELNALFDLQHTRTGKATLRWREAHSGQENISPDLGDLLDWLMTACDEARSERDQWRERASSSTNPMALVYELQAENAWLREVLDRFVVASAVITPEQGMDAPEDVCGITDVALREGREGKK